MEKKTISIFLESDDGAVSCIRAYVKEETEKAIVIRPHNGVHIFWIPKSALTKIEGSVQGYKLAPGFVRTGYDRWFLNTYGRKIILTR